MSNETDVGSCPLPLKSDLDLMVSDPLPETFNAHAQLFISPHLVKPYSRFIVAVNWDTPTEMMSITLRARLRFGHNAPTIRPTPTTINRPETISWTDRSVTFLSTFAPT